MFTIKATGRIAMYLVEYEEDSINSSSDEDNEQQSFPVLPEEPGVYYVPNIHHMQQHFFIHFGFYNAVEDEDLVDSGFPTPTDSPPAANTHVGLLQTWISAVLFTAFLY